MQPGLQQPCPHWAIEKQDKLVHLYLIRQQLDECARMVRAQRTSGPTPTSRSVHFDGSWLAAKFISPRNHCWRVPVTKMKSNIIRSSFSGPTSPGGASSPARRRWQRGTGDGWRPQGWSWSGRGLDPPRASCSSRSRMRPVSPTWWSGLRCLNANGVSCCPRA